MKDWNSLETYSDSTDISTGAGECRDICNAVREREVAGGRYWPLSSSALSGLLYPAAGAYVANEFTIFKNNGSDVPDTANKLLALTNTALAINAATTITGATAIVGATTITGDLSVSGTITSTSPGTPLTYYISLQTTLNMLYDANALNYFWPATGASVALSVPNAITSATLVELRADYGYACKNNPLRLKAGIYTPTFTSTDISSTAQSGSDQIMDVTNAYYGKRITSGFTCPTALSANQQIRFSIYDGSLGVHTGNPNYVVVTAVLKIN